MEIRKFVLLFYGSLDPGYFCEESMKDLSIHSYILSQQTRAHNTTTKIVNLLYADEAACPTLGFIREHVHPSDVPAVAAS